MHNLFINQQASLDICLKDVKKVFKHLNSHHICLNTHFKFLLPYIFLKDFHKGLVPLSTAYNQPPTSSCYHPPLLTQIHDISHEDEEEDDDNNTNNNDDDHDGDDVPQQQQIVTRYHHRTR